MCVMACTLTAYTTSSAKPWPSDSSQKPGVRKACAAVRPASPGAGAAAASGAGPAVAPLPAPPAGPADGCAADGVTAGRPSTVSPTSAGLRRNTRASGQPSRITTTPEANAVLRQPKTLIDQA